MLMRRLSRGAAFCLFSAPLLAFSQTSPPPSTPPAKLQAEPAIQLPPDQKAYQAADAIVDNDQRIKALQSFLREFPQSKRADRAREKVLRLLLDRRPQDERQVQALARYMVEHASKDNRANEEDNVAYELAEALPNGVDLRDAAAWAKEAVDAATLANITARVREKSARDKTPMEPPEEIHEYWASSRAGDLQTLADVYFHQGRLAESSRILEEGIALDPNEGALFATRGQIAHAQHNDAEALHNLELAEVHGGITPASKALLAEIYATRHGGSLDGLEAEIDQQYLSLPKAITPTRHTAPPTGRTVLVELFSGAGCDPCVAADLAVDGVLEAYPRNEVVALSFDQHIPEPDPLSNPDAVERAKYESVGWTPQVKVDGRLIDGAYGRRTRAEKVFQVLGKALDADLAAPSGVILELKAKLTPAHSIEASAQVNVANPEALKQLLSARLEPDSPSTPVARDGGVGVQDAANKPPKLVLNFALVQKVVRYSGENGIRFHSMVVRSLSRPSADGFPIAMTGSSTAFFTFDPSAISASLGQYLADYAQHNERFGTAHFLTTDTHLPLDQLAVAAFVEDSVTHHVVAAAFAPLETETQESAR